MRKPRRTASIVAAAAAVTALGLGGVVTAQANSTTPVGPTQTPQPTDSGAEDPAGSANENGAESSSDGPDMGPDANPNEPGHQDAGQSATADEGGSESASDGPDTGPDANPTEPGHQDAGG